MNVVIWLGWIFIKNEHHMHKRFLLILHSHSTISKHELGNKDMREMTLLKNVVSVAKYKLLLMAGRVIFMDNSPRLFEMFL